MAKPRSSRLETPTARLRLAVRPRPYPGPSVTRGVHLYYRRNRTAGAWVVKAANGHGEYWTKAFAEADDFEAAKKVARGDTPLCTSFASPGASPCLQQTFSLAPWERSAMDKLSEILTDILERCEEMGLELPWIVCAISPNE